MHEPDLNGFDSCARAKNNSDEIIAAFREKWLYFHALSRLIYEWSLFHDSSLLLSSYQRCFFDEE